MYDRALEWIDEGAAKVRRDRDQPFMVDEKAGIAVRHDEPPAWERLQLRLADGRRQSSK